MTVQPISAKSRSLVRKKIVHVQVYFVILICSLVEHLHTNLHSSSQVVSCVGDDDKHPAATHAPDYYNTPFTSVMIGSMSASLWTSANNVLDSGALAPISIHQVHLSTNIYCT